MSEIQNSKQKYDLEDRTLVYAKRVRNYVKKLPKTTPNIEYGRQLIKSSSSPGANYREANEALGKKDFLMRIRICRKESKESIYWLELTEPIKEQEKEKEYLIDESTQLMKIFGKILYNSENPDNKAQE